MKQLVCNRPTTKECILFISVLHSFYSGRYEAGASTSRWSRCIVQNVNQLLFQCGLRAKAVKKKREDFLARVSEVYDRRVRRLEGRLGPSREDSMELFHLSAECLRSSRRLANSVRG